MLRVSDNWKPRCQKTQTRIARKATTAGPCTAWTWPKSQRVKPWRSADGRPSVTVLVILQMPVMFGRKIHKQPSVRRHVASVLVDPTMEPCTVLECISPRIPLNDLNPFRWPPAQDDTDL